MKLSQGERPFSAHPDSTPSVTVGGLAHLSHAHEPSSALFLGARPEEGLVQQKGEDCKTVHKEARNCGTELSGQYRTWWRPNGGQFCDRATFLLICQFFFLSDTLELFYLISSSIISPRRSSLEYKGFLLYLFFEKVIFTQLRPIVFMLDGGATSAG